MRTLIASDLHLGSATGRDILRHESPRAALAAAFADADRIVLLGDVIELRDNPVAKVRERAQPVLEELGRAAAGKEVVITAGNHDHQIFREWHEHQKLGAGAPALQLEHRIEPAGDTLLSWLADSMTPAEVVMSYPGIRIRDDVWATHGHYLDAHNTVPAIEAVSAQAAARRSGRLKSQRLVPDDYEEVLGPMYSVLFARAQRIDPDAEVDVSFSLRLLQRIREPRGRIDPLNLFLTRVALPGAVTAANLAGVGRFSSDLSGTNLRQAGLRALGEAIRRLGVDAAHVVFGHTHRRGPLEGDDEGEWLAPGGALIHNTGSWVSEPWLVGNAGARSPYWPGSVTIVEEAGPPRLVPLVAEAEEAGLAA